MPSVTDRSARSRSFPDREPPSRAGECPSRRSRAHPGRKGSRLFPDVAIGWWRPSRIPDLSPKPCPRLPRGTSLPLTGIAEARLPLLLPAFLGSRLVAWIGFRDGGTNGYARTD